MNHGFLKVSACTPSIRVADCMYNAEKIIEQIKVSEDKNVKLAVFPELCITGSTCGDLFMQDTLLKGAENALREIADENKKRFSLNLCFDSKLASRIYASSDIYLMPSKSEPCGLSQLIAMRYGTVPVVNATGGLKDTVIPFDGQSEGTGFNFQSFTRGDLIDAVRRALEAYGDDRNVWDIIVKNAMNYDSSWDKPAREYMKIYNDVLA